MIGRSVRRDQRGAIGPYRAEITGEISGITGAEPGAVNLKAKTFEGLGDIGKGKAASAYAVVLIENKQGKSR